MPIGVTEGIMLGASILGSLGGSSGPDPRQYFSEWESGRAKQDTMRMGDAILGIGDQFRWSKSKPQWDANAMINNPFFSKAFGSDAGQAGMLAGFMNSAVRSSALMQASQQYRSAGELFSGISGQQAGLTGRAMQIAAGQEQQQQNAMSGLGQGLGRFLATQNPSGGVGMTGIGGALQGFSDTDIESMLATSAGSGFIPGFGGG